MGGENGTNMHYAKVAVMMLAILCDIALGCTLDFDEYNNNEDSSKPNPSMNTC